MIVAARHCLVALAGVILAGSSALAADIRVMTGGAPKEVLVVLTPEFEKQTGHKVHFTYAVISQIQQRLTAGERPDMVLMPAGALEAQAKLGVVRDQPRVNLGIVRVGFVVREGAAKPDVSTMEAFKKAMVDAKSVVHANPAATPSGAHLARVWERLGIADAVKAKAIHRNALDGGVAAIVKGEAEVGLYPVSEIIHEKGVSFAGLIPADVQLNTVYAAGIIKDGKEADASAAFVRFLTDPANAKHWKDGGFDPPG